MMKRMDQLQRLLEREPHEPPPRTILINDSHWREQQQFPPNTIMTAKYTFLTFLPKFLLEQFMRLANFYFLIISIIQIAFPQLAPTGRWYTFGPLMAILALTGIKELIEDFKRHRLDRQTNQSPAEVLVNDAFVIKQWQDIRVGDIVKVSTEKPFPTDLLLLASSEPEALCYVETSNLDGETNLKIRQGVYQTSKLQSVDEIKHLQGEFSCEGPNNRLYHFDGTFKYKDELIPVGPNQVLLRGSRLRNTPWIFGLVIYTGHDSKLLMNASATPIKKSRVEATANKQILAIFALLFLMAIICVIGYVLQNKSAMIMNAWYLQMEVDNSSLQDFKQFIVFIILFNTVVPISLYVSIEIVKLCQAIFINHDMKMYYEETDTPAIARTSNLNEELGQIDFIFSDKTGTLTKNQMEFRKCSIAGVKYGLGYTDAARGAARRAGKILPEDPKIDIDDPFFNFYDPSLLDNLTNGHPTASFIREFLTMLAVCHTVIPERDKENPNKIIYQAASPDEAALVAAAKHLGFYFNTRKPNSLQIMALSAQEQYEILNVLEFNSTRKRMSVICRTPQGKLKLFCKGADTVIFERLAPKQFFLEETKAHLEEFALEGLRTLCIAMAELNEEEYLPWLKKFQAASTTLVNRAEEVERVSEEIEKNLFLLGATGIEDKLQDGVPETIEDLMKAGIRIWMLTGDKKETAVNIGFSCQLLKPKTKILSCDVETPEEIKAWVSKQLEIIKDNKDDPLALVVEGKTLTHALGSEFKHEVIKLATQCAACICCRVSPIQKAQMVTLVKQNLNCITLAIGDGANDVSMIQAADVGIGITGHEGMQAARSSDYSIGQFSYLKRLLLVHGQLSYQRLSKVILYSFYKTLTLYLVSFYFSFRNGFSGQLPWDRISNTLWNVIYTFFAVIFLGVFEQDVPADHLMKYPQLYLNGQRNSFFNLKVFFGWFFTSIYHSLLIYFLILEFFYHDQVFPSGENQDIYTTGTMLFLCVLLTVTGKISLVSRHWVIWTHVAHWGGLIIYFIVFIVGGFIFISFYDDATALYGEAPQLLSSARFYLTLIIVPIICLLKDFTWIYFRRTIIPSDYHIIQEDAQSPKEHGDIEMNSEHLPSDFLLGTKRSGFAFSQAEREIGDAADVISQTALIRKYDTTIDKPEGN